MSDMNDPNQDPNQESMASVPPPVPAAPVATALLQHHRAHRLIPPRILRQIWSQLMVVGSYGSKLSPVGCLVWQSTPLSLLFSA